METIDLNKLVGLAAEARSIPANPAQLDVLRDYLLDCGETSAAEAVYGLGVQGVGHLVLCVVTRQMDMLMGKRTAAPLRPSGKEIKHRARRAIRKVTGRSPHELTWAEIAAIDHEALLEQTNFGETSLRQLRGQLAARGLDFLSLLGN